MNNVLPFVTREEYNSKQYAEINVEPQSPEHRAALEKFKALYDHSYKTLSALQSHYKKSGQWKPEYDEHMRRIVHHATIISANLAGVADHGQTTRLEEQTEGTAPDNVGAVSPA